MRKRQLTSTAVSNEPRVENPSKEKTALDQVRMVHRNFGHMRKENMLRLLQNESIKGVEYGVPHVMRFFHDHMFQACVTADGHREHHFAHVNYPEGLGCNWHADVVFYSPGPCRGFAFLLAVETRPTGCV